MCEVNVCYWSPGVCVLGGLDEACLARIKSELDDFLVCFKFWWRTLMALGANVPPFA